MNNFDAYRIPFFFALLLHGAIIVWLVLQVSWGHFKLSGVSPVKIINATVITSKSLEPSPKAPAPSNNLVMHSAPPQQANTPPAVNTQQVAQQAALEKQKALQAQEALAKAHALALKKQQEAAQEKEARLAAKRKAQQQAEAKKRAEQKALAEKRAQEAQAKKKKMAETKATAKATAKAKQIADAKAALKAKQIAAAKAKLAAAQAAALQKVQESEINKYKALIVQTISQNWLVPSNLPNGISCQLLVHVAPGGVVLSVSLVQSSGNAMLDQSAETAVLKSSPLPVPSGELFDKFRTLRLTVIPPSQNQTQQIEL